MQIFANNAVSTVGAPMSAAAVSMQVAPGSGSGFPSPAGGDYFLLTLGRMLAGVESALEIVMVTSRAGDILTIVRAQEGTMAVTHAVGDFASLRLTADTLANLNVNTVTAKASMTAPAFNGNATTSSSAAALSGINPVTNGGTGGSTPAAALAALGAYPATNPAAFITATGAPVQSVGGLSGAITKAQLGIDQVNNTLDANKPVSSLQQAAINAKTLGGIATSTADFLTGAAIASSATLNLDSTTGNRVHVTGNTAILAVTLTRGPRTLIFDGVLNLAHHAVNNNLPGAVNITTAPGDRAQYESDGSKVYCVAYTKADGTAIVIANGGERVLLATALVTTPVAMIDFLTIFTATYDQYTIEALGLKVSTYDSVLMCLANAGAADLRTRYSNLMVNSETAAATTSMQVAGNMHADFTGWDITIRVSNTNDAVNPKRVALNSTGQASYTPSWASMNGTIAYFAANTVTGFRLYLTNGANFSAGTIRVYGHKNT